MDSSATAPDTEEESGMSSKWSLEELRTEFEYIKKSYCVSVAFYVHLPIMFDNNYRALPLIL